VWLGEVFVSAPYLVIGVSRPRRPDSGPAVRDGGDRIVEPSRNGRRPDAEIGHCAQDYPEPAQRTAVP
jgi:hypothetical protein